MGNFFWLRCWQAQHRAGTQGRVRAGQSREAVACAGSTELDSILEGKDMTFDDWWATLTTREQARMMKDDCAEAWQEAFREGYGAKVCEKQAQEPEYKVGVRVFRLKSPKRKGTIRSLSVAHLGDGAHPLTVTMAQVSWETGHVGLSNVYVTELGIDADQKFEHFGDDADREKGRCKKCHRCTWDNGDIGKPCGMTQPSGSKCAGIFEKC